MHRFNSSYDRIEPVLGMSLGGSSNTNLAMSEAELFPVPQHMTEPDSLGACNVPMSLAPQSNVGLQHSAPNQHLRADTALNSQRRERYRLIDWLGALGFLTSSAAIALALNGGISLLRW